MSRQGDSKVGYVRGIGVGGKGEEADPKFREVRASPCQEGVWREAGL